eukprot:5766535-Prymnesium_polylepis.1
MHASVAQAKYLPYGTHSSNYEPHNERNANNGEVTMSINRRARVSLIMRLIVRRVRGPAAGVDYLK